MDQDQMQEFVKDIVAEKLDESLKDKALFPLDSTEAEIRETILKLIRDGLEEAGVPCIKMVTKEDRVELHFDDYILNFGLITRLD